MGAGPGDSAAGGGRDGSGEGCGGGGADEGGDAGADGVGEDDPDEPARFGTSAEPTWRRWRRLRARSLAASALRDRAVECAELSGRVVTLINVGSAAGSAPVGDSGLGAAAATGADAGAAAAGWFARGAPPAWSAATSATASSGCRERASKIPMVTAASVMTAAAAASFAFDGPRGTISSGTAPMTAELRAGIMPGGYAGGGAPSGLIEGGAVAGNSVGTM